MQDQALTYVYVQDLERCTTFYREVLGMRIDGAERGWARLSWDGGQLLLAAFPDGAKGNSGTTSAHLALAVDNLDGRYRELAHRAKPVSPPAATPFGRKATVCDPEGNPIDLIEVRPAGKGVSYKTVVNDILMQAPEAMEVLEDHGIRICGGCIILLNGSVRETAEYSGLSANETSELVEELNDKLAARHP